MRKLHYTLLFLFIAVALTSFFSSISFAALTEQFAITTRAISLANTVTADPPGVLSVHYNPAGLSALPEGKTFNQSFTLPWLVKTTKFEADEDFQGFMNTWGPQEGQRPDPVAGEEDTNSSGVMYLPILDRTINFIVGPSLGLSSREPESKWTFAYANYAPYGGGINHKTDSPVNYGGRTLYQQHMVYAATAASYQLTPTLSLGATVGLGQTSMGVRLELRQPNELMSLTGVLGEATKDLEIPILSELTLPPPWFGGGLGAYDQIGTFQLDIRDDFSPNYNLGLLWKPTEWFSYGVVYQSATKVQFTGGYSFRYSDQWQRMIAWNGSSPLTLITAAMLQMPHQAVPYQTGTLTSEFEFPQRVQTGIMIRPIKRLRCLFDLHWGEWSSYKEDKFVFDQPIQLFQMAKLIGYTGGDNTMIVERNLKDTIDYSLGLEYQLTRKFELRFGYGKRKTSVQDNLRDLLLFIPDFDFYGAGVGITLENHHQIDIAFGALINPSIKIPNNSSNNLNSTDFVWTGVNPYSGIDVEQETAVYMVSVGMTMPFADFIEMQKHMMHKQHEAIGHLIHLLKKPFSSSEANDLQVPEEAPH